MLPFEIPPGTTPASFFRTVVPEAHARLVPPSSGPEEYVVVAEVLGGDTFAYAVTGKGMTVSEGARPCSLWISVEKETLDRFLLDWSTERRFIPKFKPRGDVMLMTDPRVLKRLAMVSGKVELALPDFEGGRAALFVGAGGGRKVAITGRAADDADVVIEATMATFERMLEGALPPDEAISGDHVALRGKKLVAMQFAFALAPFFPLPAGR